MSTKLLSKVVCLLAMAVVFMPGELYARHAEQKLVTLNMADVPLEQVMRSIEQQTNYVFLNKDIDVTQKVSINVTSRTVEETMAILLAGKDIDFRIESAHIILFRKGEPFAGRGGEI